VVFVVTKEVLDTHEARLSVEIENKAVEDAKRKAARKIAREIHIPGFRKGRAPYNRVVRYVGEATVLQEATDQLLQDIYSDVLDKAEVKPYAAGALEDMASDPLTFKIKIPLEPTADLGDYLSLRLEREEAVISDEEIDTVLEQIRGEHAMLEPVERPSEMGDEVHINVLGTTDDEEVIVEEEHIEVQLDPERPFFSPGFVDELIGLNEGDEKAFTLTVPDDFAEEDLRGEEVTFEVTVVHVYERQLPELDDALASTAGSFETLDELKADVVKRMTEYKTNQAQNDYRTALLDTLVEQAELHYPPVMLEDTINDIIEETTQRLERDYQIPLEDALRLEGRTMEQLREDMRPQAERRIGNSLVLLELAKAEHIEVSNDEVVQGYRDMMMSLNTGGDEAINEDLFKNMDLNSEFGQYIRSNTYNRKVMERLEQIGRGQIDVEGASEETDAEEIATDATETSAVDVVEETPETTAEATDATESTASAPDEQAEV